MERAQVEMMEKGEKGHLQKVGRRKRQVCGRRSFSFNGKRLVFRGPMPIAGWAEASRPLHGERLLRKKPVCYVVCQLPKTRGLLPVWRANS